MLLFLFKKANFLELCLNIAYIALKFMKRKVTKIKTPKNLKEDCSETHEFWIENMTSCDFEDYMDEFTTK